jgi:hypothetical protein
MADETDIWLEALSGRAADDSEPAREARALRAAMLRQPKPDPAPVAARDAAREAALLECARQAGLIPIPARVRPQWKRVARSNRLLSWPALGAYTALACSAVVAFILWHPTRRSEVVRGAPEGIVVLHAGEPRELKQQILRELRAAGIPAQGYERLGAQGIDADLPQPLPQSVRAVLARHHIPVPHDGVLRLEITATAAP